ncbi:hypothetical protein N7488_005339 [Penicillium malachiteum]|nr:hypothetical protein N7488_005339 [Penicillium malachiteum]
MLSLVNTAILVYGTPEMPEQILATLVSRILPRVWLDLLSNYPAPKLAAVLNLPYVTWTITGKLPQRLRELYDHYGDVVTASIEGYIWSQETRNGTFQEGPGVPEVYTPAPPGQLEAHMINASEAHHSRQKRLLTHAFSERALRDHESLIMSYIDLFIQKIRTVADRRQSGNLEEWLNFLTFDIVGDLAFGEPFGCWKSSDYHPWVATIFQSIKTGAFLRAVSVYPFLVVQIRKVLPNRVIQKRLAHYQMSKDKVAQRLAIERTRPDLMSYILKHNDDRGMQRPEIEINAGIIIQARSETTATKHPSCCQRAVKEVPVREAFQTDSQITFLATAKLSYISAVIEESLRMFPPAPGVGPRLVFIGGATIDGKFFPEGIDKGKPYRSKYPSHTIPPFGDTRTFLSQIHFFQSGGWKQRINTADQRDALQPFSFGPRSCIGRNLAYAEMQTVLTQILWHFGVSLQSPSVQWAQVKSYIVWEKLPLLVNLKEA